MQFQCPGLGVKDFGAQLWALKIGSRQFQRPGLGVENDVWAEFFVRFGLLESGVFETYPSLLVRINFMTECVWARYEL